MLSLLLLQWKIIGGVIIGIVLTSFLRRPVIATYKNFLGRAPLIRKYWQFVIPFTIFSAVAYILVCNYTLAENLAKNLTILGHWVTLLFAVFIGYFAFLQVEENRFDKLKELGTMYFKNSSYIRALEAYVAAASINPRDWNMLSEMLETYLAVNDYQNFDEKIILLERCTLEAREKAVLGYLKATRHLLELDIGRAKKEIAYCVKSMQECGKSSGRFWSFKEIKESLAYQKLVGESKTIFDNLVRYLLQELDEKNRQAFEAENYILNNPPAEHS